ncbi:MAG: hypothetical protein RL329_3247 [Bacteroidota bacterium]
MGFEAGALQNTLIRIEIGANRYYKSLKIESNKGRLAAFRTLPTLQPFIWTLL